MKHPITIIITEAEFKVSDFQKPRIFDNPNFRKPGLRELGFSGTRICGNSDFRRLGISETRLFGKSDFRKLGF